VFPALCEVCGAASCGIGRKSMMVMSNAHGKDWAVGGPQDGEVKLANQG